MPWPVPALPRSTREYTDETVPLNSVIAVCGDRSALASYASFYGYDYSYMYNTPTSWDAEGRITSAIARAAFDSSARVYYTVGHDELPLGAEMLDSLAKANIETAEINLLTTTIPADCDALIVFAPGADFTPEEAHKVSAYLGDGGRLLLVTMTEAVTGVSTPNLDSIPAEYGVGRKGGYVLEGDAASYVQAPYLILPKVCVSEVTGGLGNLNIVCGLSEALDPGDTDGAAYTVTSVLASGDTVTSVLASGDKSYKKENVGDTLEKEDGDEDGPFVLALEVEQTLLAWPGYNNELRALSLRLAGGFKGGYPSAGVSLEVLRVVTLEFATWAEELGYYTGQDEERIYMGQISLGF